MSRCLAAAAVLAVTAHDAGAAPGSNPQDEVVARIGTTEIKASELDALAAGEMTRLRSQEYEIRRRALDEHISRTLIEQEAAKRKVSVDELMRVEVTEKAKPVTPEEIKSTYEEVKARLAGVPEVEGLKQVEERLKRQRLGIRRAEFVGELRQQAAVQVLLEPPRMAIAPAGGYFKGPEGAPVTIVEYSDFQCPACRVAAPTLTRVEEQFRGKLRVVFRDLPLSMHPDAPKAAEAAACAQDQGKFWEMHDKLFANQRALKVPDLKRYAGELTLDQAKFDQCLDSGTKAAGVKQSMDEARRYGVNATPTIFVNGRIMSGVPSYEMLARAVEEELARVKAPAGGAPATRR